MRPFLFRALAFIIGGSIGLSAAVYSEAARKIEPKDGPKPFPIIIEKQPEEEPEKAVKLTAGDKQMLQKVALCEASKTDPDAMALVMLVVLNRVKDDSGNFPNSVEKVLTQHSGDLWQFSCVKEGGGFWAAQPNEASETAIKMIENGFDESAGAIFFNQTGQKSWASRHRTFLFTAYGHDFYG